MKSRVMLLTSGERLVYADVSEVEESLTGVSFTAKNGNRVTIRKGQFALVIEQEYPK